MSDSVRPHRWKPTRLPCPLVYQPANPEGSTFKTQAESDRFLPPMLLPLYSNTIVSFKAPDTSLLPPLLLCGLICAAKRCCQKQIRCVIPLLTTFPPMVFHSYQAKGSLPHVMCIEANAMALAFEKRECFIARSVS